MNIKHLENFKRFEATIDGYTAHTQYNLEDGYIDIRHTIVPKEIGGRGIASKLVQETYNWGESQGLKLKATCSYALTWCKRHKKEVAISDEYTNGGCAL